MGVGNIFLFLFIKKTKSLPLIVDNISVTLSKRSPRGDVASIDTAILIINGKIACAWRLPRGFGPLSELALRGGGNITVLGNVLR